MHLHFPTTCIPMSCYPNNMIFILHHPSPNFPEHSFTPQHHLFIHFPTFPSLQSFNHSITSPHQFTPSRNHFDSTNRQKFHNFMDSMSPTYTHIVHTVSLHHLKQFIIMIICFDTKCQLLNVNLVVNLVEIRAPSSLELL